MQADNLNQDNVEKLTKLFEKMQKKNPDILFRFIDSKYIQKKDCLFKAKCQEIKKGR